MSHVHSVAGQDQKRNFLLHVTDIRRKERWLVDGGAFVSLIPPTPQQRRQGSNGMQLMAANGTGISCFGTTSRTITIGNTNFTYEYIIADVRTRILGSDFLAHFYLAPNHRDALLVNLKDFSTLPAQHVGKIDYQPINFIDEDPCYKLLDSFPEVLTPTFTIQAPKHECQVPARTGRQSLIASPWGPGLAD